jgi:hypothetical protein
MVRVEKMFEDIQSKLPRNLINSFSVINSFYVSFLMRKTVIFMVGKFMVLYLMSEQFSNVDFGIKQFSVLILELFSCNQGSWKKDESC